MCNAVRDDEREISFHLMPSVDYFRSMLTMGWKEVGLGVDRAPGLHFAALICCCATSSCSPFKRLPSTWPSPHKWWSLSWTTCTLTLWTAFTVRTLAFIMVLWCFDG